MNFDEDARAKMVDRLVESGVPLTQAIAVVMALKFSLDNSEFSAAYGSFTKDNLAIFLEKAVA